MIYHCGPVIDEAQNKVVAAGPTTSARMNDLTGYMLDAGVRGLIGKGGMSEIVRDELRRRAVYFALHRGMRRSRRFMHGTGRLSLSGTWDGKGIWEIKLTDLPVVVGIDAHGGDLFVR